METLKRLRLAAQTAAWAKPTQAGASARDGLHLAQSRETLERFGLDLTHALPGQPEAAPDVLERLRIGVVEAVAQDQDLPLAVSQGRQRLSQCLAAQRDLDLFV